jgi:hypothetical protein
MGSAVPLRARDRGLLGLLSVLVAVSLTMKVMLGATIEAPPSDGPASVQNHLVQILERQGFETSVRQLRIQSSIVFARRGNCTLSVRNAFGGAATEAAFADDARPIGIVRYLYKGEVYNSPPTLRVHAAVIEASFLHAMGLKPDLHVPLALAVSRGCANSPFGFEDIRFET